MLFTDPDVVRWDLSRPYVFNQFAYATDGCAMARITSSEDEHSDESVRVPPMESTWAKHFKQGSKWTKFGLQDIGDLVPRADEDCGTCPACDNKPVKCPACDGDPYSCDDPDCDDGWIPDRSCKLCRGEPYYGGVYQQVGDTFLLYRFAKRLAKIPGCEVAIAEPSPFPTWEGYQQMMRPVLFRSDLISGIVAPADPTR